MMSEKRFSKLSSSIDYFDVWDSVEEKGYTLEEVCEKLNEQQATIDKLDQENADLLGARIKAQEEWEKCTDKLKAKILEQQATIQSLKEENEKLTKMLNANYKTNNELVQYIQMLESDNDE